MKSGAKQSVYSLVGKTISKVKYDIGYCSLDLEFTDGTQVTIDAPEAFDFIVSIDDLRIAEDTDYD